MSGLKRAVLSCLKDEKTAKKDKFQIAYMLFNSEDIVKIQEARAAPEKMIPSVRNYNDKEIDFLITLVPEAAVDTAPKIIRSR